MSQADLVGWYDFEWSGGKFDVCFRPGGHFFVPEFQAPATWKLDGNQIKIDWKKFGKYIMKWDVGKKTMDGMLDKEGADPTKDWRKANFREPLSTVEKLLYGLGAGTEWELQWMEGSFPVQFKCDGYNHFKCEKFPAHAHWSIDGDKIKINWAAFGTYTLKIDAKNKTMYGAGDGAADPPAEHEWRKARWLRDNTDMNTIEACDQHETKACDHHEYCDGNHGQARVPKACDQHENCDGNHSPVGPASADSICVPVTIEDELDATDGGSCSCKLFG